VFLTANLMRAAMEQQPVVRDAEQFLISPRGRFERCMLRDLYVLSEAWKSQPIRHAQLRALARDEYDAVEALLAAAVADGRMDNLRQVRDFMCHRDRREYWDTGHVAAALIG